MLFRSRGRDLRYSVIPTMYEHGSESASQGLRALMRGFSDQVGGTVVPLDPSFRDAASRGLTPSRFAPQSKGVRAYRGLLRGMGLLGPVAGGRFPATG